MARMTNLLSVSDAYEAKARLAPGLLTGATLVPCAWVIGVPLVGWIGAVIAGTGFGGLVGVLLSHISSAMGNRYQRKVWRRWPLDAPTNVRLAPWDLTCSQQHKELLYRKIQGLTGVSIIAAVEGGDRAEVERTINDATGQVRAVFWKSPAADRLHTHNADYGFARNFTGLRAVWLVLAAASACVCWIYYERGQASLFLPVLSSCILIAAVPSAFWVFPQYVKDKAEQYAETFLAVIAQWATTAHVD